MKLLALPPMRGMANDLATAAGLDRVECQLDRFDNGEMQISLEGPVDGEDCIALGSLTPPDEQLLGFLLLCDTLSKEGAKSIQAVLPYLAYARQDRDERGKSRAAAWTGALLQTCGVQSVITVDIHSEDAKNLYPVPIQSVSPGKLFGRIVKDLEFRDATIVAPDRGACERCDAVRIAAGVARPLAWFTKERSAYGVRHLSLNGSIGAEAIIVDDILDTGATLLGACRELQNRGAKRIVIMVTHGLFTGNAWKQLWHFGAEHIYCTDSVPIAVTIEPGRVTLLPISPLLAEAFRSQKMVSAGVAQEA